MPISLTFSMNSTGNQILVLHFQKMSNIISVIFLREEVLAMKLRRHDFTTAKTLINKGTWDLLSEVA